MAKQLLIAHLLQHLKITKTTLNIAQLLSLFLTLIFDYNGIALVYF